MFVLRRAPGVSLGFTPANRQGVVLACRRLGVSSTAGTDEIKAAFRQLAKTMHPDKQDASISEARRSAAEEEFKAVQKAYECLRDPEQRAAYDSGRVLKADRVA